MIQRVKLAVGQEGRTRELGQGMLLLALSGSTVGGFLGMVSIATRALGR